MANAKRASMREGPLAALFRKTDEAAEEEPGDRSEIGQSPSERPRESERPHPGLSASTETREEQRDEPGPVPTPRERLRHAFSSELPESVTDRPSARPVMD